MHAGNYQAAAEVFGRFGGVLTEPAPGQHIRKVVVPFMGQLPVVSEVLSALDEAVCRTPGTVDPCLLYLGSVVGEAGGQLEFVDLNDRQ